MVTEALAMPANNASSCQRAHFLPETREFPVGFPGFNRKGWPPHTGCGEAQNSSIHRRIFVESALDPSARQCQVPFTTDALGSIRVRGGQRLLTPTLLQGDHSTMRVTRPAPTVLWPSRTAKRDPSSIAIRWSNSTVSSALSPGITMSSPSLSSTVPVMSVVRK